MRFYANRSQVLPDAPVLFVWAIHEDVAGGEAGQVALRTTCKRCGVFSEALWKRVTAAEMAECARETERIAVEQLGERHPYMEGPPFALPGAVCPAIGDVQTFARDFETRVPTGRHHFPVDPADREVSTFQGLGEPVRMWLIYDRPEDYPEHVVVRERHLYWRPGGGVDERALAEVQLARSVEEARRLIPKGAAMFMRGEEDPRAIVEVWM
jgi:hypothetical protein